MKCLRVVGVLVLFLLGANSACSKPMPLSFESFVKQSDAIGVVHIHQVFAKDKSSDGYAKGTVIENIKGELDKEVYIRWQGIQLTKTGAFLVFLKENETGGYSPTHGSSSFWYIQFAKGTECCEKFIVSDNSISLVKPKGQISAPVYFNSIPDDINPIDAPGFFLKDVKLKIDKIEHGEN